MLSARARSFISSTIILGSFGAAIIAVLVVLMYAFGTSLAVIALGVLVAICWFVVLAGHYIRHFERKESKEKSEQYRHFMRALKELLDAVNDDLTGTSDRGKERIAIAAEAVREASFLLTLSAPDDVLAPVQRALRLAPPSPSDDLERGEYVQRWIQAIIAIRCDCGFSKTKLGAAEMLPLIRDVSYFVDQDEDELAE